VSDTLPTFFKIDVADGSLLDFFFGLPEVFELDFFLASMNYVFVFMLKKLSVK
jgi:hypothetical protein